MPDGQKQNRSFLQDETGTTATEYGLIAMLVSVGAIVALWLLGDSMTDLYAIDSAAVNAAVAGNE